MDCEDEEKRGMKSESSCRPCEYAAQKDQREFCNARLGRRSFC